MTISWGLTFLWSSLYIFILALASLSLLLAVTMSPLSLAGSGLRSGKMVFTLRPNSSSAGLAPVVGCGVDLKLLRWRLRSMYGSLCWVMLVCHTLLRCFMKVSQVPLASGSSAEIVGLWVMPIFLK